MAGALKLSIFWTISSFAFALLQAENSGFSIELFHRNALNPSFLNTSEAPHPSNNASQLSVDRIGHFNLTLVFPNSVHSLVRYGDNDYLMRISIGTPPVKIIAALTTGVDFVWAQCEPCAQCSIQNGRIFNPQYSSTYKPVMYGTSHCQSFHDHTFKENNGDACRYGYSFADKTSIGGVLATDTVSLVSDNGQPFSLPNTVIGCTADSKPSFDGTGMVGLGRGPISLISRMDHLIGGKFSYCLVPAYSSHSSKMNFGDLSMVSGPGVVTTPLTAKDSDIFYRLTLEAISVGNERLPYNTDPNMPVEPGNIILDTGTSLTFLPSFLYNRLEAKLKEFIPLEPVNDPTGQTSLCYKTNTDLNHPPITMHFTGADIKLSPLNVFVRMAEGDIACLAFVTEYNDINFVYGNIQQVNFMIGYDLKAGTVSFKRADCTLN